MCKVIFLRKRIVIIFYYMSFIVEYWIIVNLFGVLKLFVCFCIKDVCKVIIKKLKKDFLLILKGEDLSEVMKFYKEKWGFFLCVGVIDGIYILI